MNVRSTKCYTRLPIVEKLVRGHLLKNTDSKYWIKAFNTASELEWDFACDLVVKAGKLMQQGYSKLHIWWLPSMIREIRLK